jgi:hypothetical protein
VCSGRRDTGGPAFEPRDLKFSVHQPGVRPYSRPHDIEQHVLDLRPDDPPASRSAAVFVGVTAIKAVSVTTEQWQWPTINDHRCSHRGPALRPHDAAWLEPAFRGRGEAAWRAAVQAHAPDG